MKQGARNIDLDLPALHSGQLAAFEKMSRYFVVRCGRRFGKTTFGTIVACDAIARGMLVGWFAPDYKRINEVWHEMKEILAPIEARSSRNEGVFRAITGGRTDLWTLEDEHAGRSRKYHLVIIDEAAFAKPNMMATWERAIKPTLLDYAGSALVLSNTNGAVPDQFFWRICNEPEHGFREYHAPSHHNPLLPRGDLESWAQTMHPLVYRQEILAEFVDWSGVAFFALPSLLENDKPVGAPRTPYEAVFAVVDTALKTGKENDGTAVILFGVDRINNRLLILDWDIVQIEGALLERWLPCVFTNLEDLARSTRARYGSLGAFIEDTGAGTVLLQQARLRGWLATAIPQTLTSLGKDERALNVSGYVHQGKVKLTEQAFNKTVVYKGASRNHLITQVTGFRVGDKDAAKRADDLLDCFAYGIAVSLGNSEGF